MKLSTLTSEKAKERIFAKDAPRALRTTAFFLFEYQCRSINPDTGELYSDATALSNVLKWMDESQERQDRLNRIPTPLQLRRLQMLADGMSIKQIAAKDHVSREGVKQNFYRMRRRLRVDTLYQAIAISVSSGWLDVDRSDK